VETYPIPARHGGRLARLARRVVLGAMPLYTFSLLSFAPFVAVAARTRRARDWAVAAGYAAATALWIALPTDQATASTAIMLSLALLGSVHAFYALSRADRAAEAVGGQHTDLPALGTPGGQRAALAAAQLAAHRRAEARKLLARQPALGFQLGIGRPDLPREYDDGGLVDINHLSAEALADRLRLTADQAQAVVRAREQLGGFEDSADLVTYANLDPHHVDVLREFLVFPRA
jgi:DNA uptake protein ComE-like DNA-binding protein